MATKLENTEAGYVVSVITGIGRRRRVPREPVLVPYGDKARLKEVLTQQAEAARIAVGMVNTERRPVV